MKKILLAVLLAVGAFTTFYSCNKELLDVVTGTQPVQTDSWRTALVTQLQNAHSNAEREQIMAANGQHLTTQLVAFLRNSGYGCRIDTITYHYGSGTADSTLSGDGNRYNGGFTNQPYAIVKGGDCFRDSLAVFILCFNGTFGLHSKSSSYIGSKSLSFTIEQGNGINYYIPDYLSSIAIADRFGVKIYEGKGWDKEISFERAASLQPDLASIQVTVGVQPGDYFNLGADTYNGKPAVNPNRRY